MSCLIRLTSIILQAYVERNFWSSRFSFSDEHTGVRNSTSPLIGNSQTDSAALALSTTIFHIELLACSQKLDTWSPFGRNCVFSALSKYGLFVVSLIYVVRDHSLVWPYECYSQLFNHHLFAFNLVGLKLWIYNQMNGNYSFSFQYLGNG